MVLIGALSVGALVVLSSWVHSSSHLDRAITGWQGHRLATIIRRGRGCLLPLHGAILVSGSALRCHRTV
uniref:Putative secreted peptide n=1 Tax=Anopheles braziliensis TaxID=58242 RepID=A0A2M3ZMD6_9DIPT